jgi:predicted Zn-ribbon and HTH transcriptional regulator
MRSISAPNLAALQARSLVARDFLWIIARTGDTGAAAPVGFWSDAGNVSADVIDPDTGAAVTRDWYGSGTLISIDDIPLVANLTIQTVAIRMSQLDELVEQAVREYDCKQARVQVFRGLFNPSTRLMVAPAECRFVGFVDEIEIKTPSENEDGGVTFSCTSHTQEMTRANPDTRSDASQKLRNPTDNFFQDVAVISEWEMFWGKKSGKITASPARKPFTFAGQTVGGQPPSSR